MSSEVVSRIRQLAERTAIEIAWKQWNSLMPGTLSVQDGSAWTIVDPEALVFVSLAFSPRERRLEDAVAAWARSAGFLMSKPRFKSLGTMFPESVDRRTADFASYAFEGGDRRWKSLAAPATREAQVSRKKKAGSPKLLGGPAIVLRLRAGFGLNAKADILGMLLGLGGDDANLNLIASATGYSQRMIRTATKEMKIAGFVREIEGRPSSFYLDPQPWSRLMQPDERPANGRDSILPKWQFWGALFGFLCHVQQWGESAAEMEWTTYVASSKARDLFEEHRCRLEDAGIRLRSSNAVRGGGAQFLDTFLEAVRLVRERTLQAI